jgi:hypothetical protein
MSVGVDKSGEDDVAFAVYLGDFPSVPTHPGVTQSVGSLPDGNNLPGGAQNGCVLEDAEFAEIVSPPRPWANGGGAEGQ